MHLTSPASGSRVRTFQPLLPLSAAPLAKMQASRRLCCHHRSLACAVLVPTCLHAPPRGCPEPAWALAVALDKTDWPWKECRCRRGPKDTSRNRPRVWSRLKLQEQLSVTWAFGYRMTASPSVPTDFSEAQAAIWRRHVSPSLSLLSSLHLSLYSRLSLSPSVSVSFSWPLCGPLSFSVSTCVSLPFSLHLSPSLFFYFSRPL